MPRGDGTGPTREGPATGKGDRCKERFSAGRKMEGGHCRREGGLVCPQSGTKATCGECTLLAKDKQPKCRARKGGE
jgi:hypothetical protein